VLNIYFGKEFNGEADVCDWSWHRSGSQVELHPTSLTWAKHIVYTLVFPGLFLALGCYFCGLPWNAGLTKGSPPVVETDDEKKAELRQLLDRELEVARNTLTAERYSELEKKLVDRKPALASQQAELDARAFRLGMIVSLVGWLLISPMLLLGLIVVFRLIRLPFARVRIDREEGGGLILIILKYFWTREIRVVRPFGTIFSTRFSQSKNLNVQRHLRKHTSWIVSFLADPGPEDRLPSFKIEEKRGWFSNDYVPDRVHDFIFDLSKATGLPTVNPKR